MTEKAETTDIVKVIVDNSEALGLAIKSIPNTAPSWIDISTALLTPTIALVALVIAYYQYSTNRRRFLYETYERKLKVFQEVRAVIREIAFNANISHQMRRDLYDSITEATFLFDHKVQSYLDELSKKVMDVTGKFNIVYGEDGKGDQAYSEKRREEIKEELYSLTMWFFEQEKVINELFTPYIRIK